MRAKMPDLDKWLDAFEPRGARTPGPPQTPEQMMGVMDLWRHALTAHPPGA